MGTLKLPSAGFVYVDAQVLIYSVEKHPIYSVMIEPLWQAVQDGTLEVQTSELSILETLVQPIKKSNADLIRDYEQFLQLPGIRLLSITPSVLRQAAELRAATKLRTPDAIHAATALLARTDLFITNDFAFRGWSHFKVQILDDLKGS